MLTTTQPYASQADAVSVSENETEVRKIVDRIVAKYGDEGTRNLAIGGDVLAYARWQKSTSPTQYEATDLDTLMNRVRNLVAMRIHISMKSIRIGDWLRSHVLRELVREHAADEVADALSYFEYRTIYGRALSFCKSELYGEIRPGWLDFCKSIAAFRATGKRVSSMQFMELANECEVRIRQVMTRGRAEGQSSATVTSKAAKERKAKSAANAAVTTSISDAIAASHLTPAAVLAIVEHVSKELGKPLPPHIGFNPVTCTVNDCDLLASTLWQARKYDEMIALRDRLSNMISTINRAQEASTSTRSHATSLVA